jgi:hypothetical protein
MYLAYYSIGYVAKNKLEKAISDYLTGIDRTCIPDNDFKRFTNAVIEKIKDLCIIHSKCKPKDPRLFQCGTREKDFMLSGIDCVAFYFYHSTKDYREGVVFIDRVEN